jgi:peptidoglycan/xylan/chitin deacetylase (PgdA/CDA1 family)
LSDANRKSLKHNEASVRLMAFSVDLDPLSAYYNIHSLGDAPRMLRRVIMERALPRFIDLAEELGIKGTLFVVGSDLGYAAPTVTELHRAGYEIANHTHNHRYDFLRLAGAELEKEVLDAHYALRAACGVPPLGFRTPGYGANRRLIEVLKGLGYVYDSSMLPSFPYYMAKGVVMATMALTGRKSKAIMHNPGMLLGPRQPYCPDRARPWRRLRGKGGAAGGPEAEVMEIPIAVSPLLGLPIIGTTLVVAPPYLKRSISRSASRLEFVNFECHGIDLIDAKEDRIPMELVSRQPDLKVGLKEKRSALKGFVAELLKTHKPVTLLEAARHFNRVTSGIEGAKSGMEGTVKKVP